MLLSSLIILPIIGIFILSSIINYSLVKKPNLFKSITLFVTIIDIAISLILLILFDYSSKQFQFVNEKYDIGHYDIYLGIDGMSIYFVLLTAIIMPISIVSNWKSIMGKTKTLLMIILLLQTSLIIVFLVLDILMFYIFFESILAPLFILIGVFGSNEKVRASFYFFLYTLLGSLFMLLSIITMLSLIGSTDFSLVFKSNYIHITQLFLFIGIFIAFAVKTPTIYLNSWLLKAHVESPLAGSIILAGIVLKLSLYGIFRLILTILPKAFLYFTYIIFLVGVITIWYASLSTLRTIDIKELIAYSSVSHAAVYFLGVFSNVLHGLQGGISLGLAHGFVSSGLFICAGGALYDRSSTRLITYYRGIAQAMPLFCVLFFILCLGNCGVPLTLNFLGEFLSLYGVFERLPLAGILASSSIVFSAGYTIFMYNRIAFAGSYNMDFFENYIPDINKREYVILLTLVLFTVILGVYPSVIFDGLNYYLYSVIYSLDYDHGSIITLAYSLLGFSLSKKGLDLSDPYDQVLDYIYNMYFHNMMFNIGLICIIVSLCTMSITFNYTLKNKCFMLYLYTCRFIHRNYTVIITLLVIFFLVIYSINMEPVYAEGPCDQRVKEMELDQLERLLDLKGVPTRFAPGSPYIGLGERMDMWNLSVTTGREPKGPFFEIHTNHQGIVQAYMFEYFNPKPKL